MISGSQAKPSKLDRNGSRAIRRIAIVPGMNWQLEVAVEVAQDLRSETRLLGRVTSRVQGRGGCGFEVAFNDFATIAEEQSSLLFADDDRGANEIDTATDAPMQTPALKNSRNQGQSTQMNHR